MDSINSEQRIAHLDKRTLTDNRNELNTKIENREQINKIVIISVSIILSFFIVNGFNRAASNDCTEDPRDTFVCQNVDQLKRGPLILAFIVGLGAGLGISSTSLSEIGTENHRNLRKNIDQKLSNIYFETSD